MSQKTYRRLTRFLFLLLFLLFFLLYLLLSGQPGHRRRGGGGGAGGWEERRLTLGDVQVSEIRSGGFLVQEFPEIESTSVSAGDFPQKLTLCATSVHNEGESAVNVSLAVSGTVHSPDAPVNPGLCCAVYHYAGDADPAGGDYAALLSDGSWTALPHDRQNLELWISRLRPMVFQLQPGETRRLVLLFWVDEAVLPTVTELDRNAYSVTVKLTSRAAY